jgi:hypothetical protein
MMIEMISAPKRPVAGLAALAAFAILFAHAQAPTARAQWTPPDANNNISNTNTGGNVGIGTSTPIKRLDVNGSIIAGNSISLGRGVTDYAGISFNRDVDTGTIFNPQRLAYQIHAGSGTNKLFFSAYNTAGTQLGFPLTFDGMSVGVGTVSPSTSLHLSSAAAAYNGLGQFLITDSADASRNLRFGYDSSAEAGWVQASKIGTGYKPLLLNPNDGNVGVGTATPGAKLDVNGPIRTSGPYGFSIGNDINRQRVEIDPPSSTFFFLTASNGAAPAAAGALSITNSYGSLPAPTNGLYVQGSVRVGTTAASAYKLDVNGAANVTGDVNVTGAITGGSIQARYQDVAEWVPSAQELAPGTVVVLDQARANHVLASASAYDTSVAGVVSAQPGLLLGEGGEGRVMVATTGRVRVKVDATRGPIKIGDLLVTSDIAGVAMRSEPVVVGGRKLHAPGTIIGKALEPLAGGVGEILVLLSMQ